MEKGGEGFQGAAAATAHHKKTVYNNRRSPCPRNSVWVPAIPKWEKEFCKKVGLFEWEDFVEAKKLVTGSSSHSKILEWNDEAAKEAFTAAKTRFRAQANGDEVIANPADDEYTNPDAYIDEIVWDDANNEANPDETLEFPGGRGESVGDDVEEERNDEATNLNNNNNEYVPDYYHVRIEDIVPTGWDVDLEEMSRGQVLTGMIVGED
ncbi:hypothetical protein ABFS83_14G220000 [Erythranthe nasuta]